MSHQYISRMTYFTVFLHIHMVGDVHRLDSAASDIKKKQAVTTNKQQPRWQFGEPHTHKASCMQKIWRLLVPGKCKINLFSISFFCSHACVLPRGQWLHTALNTQLRISIEASFVVLASCVIELRIYIRAHDATVGSSVLAGQPAGCGTWLSIRRPGEVTLGADRGSSLAQNLKNCQKKRPLFAAAENAPPQRCVPANGEEICSRRNGRSHSQQPCMREACSKVRLHVQ